MASITYNALDSGAETTTWHGVEFEDGKSVKTDDPLLIAAAQNNRYFKVTGATKDDEAKADEEIREIKRRGRPPILPMGVPVDVDLAKDA